MWGAASARLRIGQRVIKPFRNGCMRPSELIRGSASTGSTNDKLGKFRIDINPALTWPRDRFGQLMDVVDD